MGRRVGWTVIVAATFLVAAACQQGDEPKPAGQAATTSVTTPPEPRVALKNSLYSPAGIEIPAGGKVVWVFDDAGIPHTVTSDANLFGTQPSGQVQGTFEHVFPEAGTFKYHCDFHPAMVGTVTVR